MAQFPTAIPDLVDALTTEHLSEFHAGFGHVEGENYMLATDRALATKLGIGASTPTNIDDVLYVTGAGNTAYGKRGLSKIAEASGTGASGVITFSSIPTTYRELELSLYGRSDAAVTGATVRLTCEASPTAGAYDYEYAIAGGGTVSGQENIGSNDYFLLGLVPGASSTASLYTSLKVWLPEYAKTSNWKAIQWLSAGITHLSTTVLNPSFGGGALEQTAAIGTLKATLSSGNWTTDSRATLWGKAA